MARNRLTWQNVNAPNYGSSMSGMVAANRMFQDALGGLNTSLGSFITNRKEAENEALLKQQQAAEAGFLRQLAAVSGDTEREAALRRSLSTNTDVGNTFLGDQLTNFRNAQLTGNTTAENLRQTALENDRTNRDNAFMDAFRPTAGSVAGYVSKGGGSPFEVMSEEQLIAFNMLPMAEQTRLLAAWSGEQTSNLGRDNTRLNMSQTRQNMHQSGVRFRDEQTNISNSRMADAAIVHALSVSPDPVVQRRELVDFVARNGGSPTAILAAFDRQVKASQNVSGGGTSGGGAGQSGGTPAPTNTDIGTILGNNPASEAERLFGEFRTRAAQEESLLSRAMIEAGERNSSLASLYEKAVKDFPETIGKLSSTEYNKLFTDIKNKHSNLTNDQIALAIEQQFQMGPSNWESSPILTNTPFTFIPSLIGAALFPDWGREAGVNIEGLQRTAKAVGTPEVRNLAVTQQQAVANAERVLQERLQGVAQAEQRKQQAQIHYQQWGNPTVLSDAERDLQLEQDNLDSLLNSFRTDENLSEILLPLFRDPENPGKTISVQERRERTEAAEKANEVTARNRNEAQRVIAVIEAQIERLQDEHRSLPVDSPRTAELAFELDRLRRSLREAKKQAR